MAEEFESKVVVITRERFMDYFTVTMPDNQSEDLEATEALKWFQERNANVHTIEKALDYAWEHGEAVVEVSFWREPEINPSRVKPQI